MLSCSDPLRWVCFCLDPSVIFAPCLLHLFSCTTTPLACHTPTCTKSLSVLKKSSFKPRVVNILIWSTSTALGLTSFLNSLWRNIYAFYHISHSPSGANHQSTVNFCRRGFCYMNHLEKCTRLRAKENFFIFSRMKVKICHIFQCIRHIKVILKHWKLSVWGKKNILSIHGLQAWLGKWRILSVHCVLYFCTVI